MSFKDQIEPKCIFEQDQEFNAYGIPKYNLNSFIQEQVSISLSEGLSEIIKETVNELMNEELKTILKGELKTFIAKSINEAIKNQFSSIGEQKTYKDYMNYNHSMPENMTKMNPTSDGLRI